MRERARDAVRPFARRSVEPEEHVGRADGPVVVQRAELDAATVGQDAGAADKRDVVEVDHVEAGVEDLADAARFQERPAGLVRGERREKSERAAEPVDGHAGMLVAGAARPLGREQAVRVLAVDHVDRVAAVGEFVREPLDGDPVAAEVARRVERRDHAEPQRAWGRVCHRIAHTDQLAKSRPQNSRNRSTSSFK